MVYFVYAIKSLKDGRIYVGMSSDVERRVSEHNAGKTKSSKGYCPWVLFFTEKCETRVDARIREKYYKSGSGKEKLKVMAP